jgi:hypothetical protein
MPTNFSNILKNRTSNLQKLTDNINSVTKGGNRPTDERFWKLDTDKAGNGFAVIRFLPQPPGEDEDSPFIKYMDYGFKGKGGWYIEKSLYTLGVTDPVFEYTSALWNSGIEENKDKARKIRLNKHFVSNILVIKDPANPENEGKVFLYRYGNSIFKMIQEQVSPEVPDPDFEPCDVFDPIEGKNLRLKCYNGSNNMRSYDKSTFDAASPLAEDEEAMEKIWKQAYPLKPLIAPSEFKSYDELKKLFYKALGLSGEVAPSNDSKHSPMGEMDDEIPDFDNKSTKTKEPDPIPETEEEDDDEMAFFKGLAED